MLVRLKNRLIYTSTHSPNFTWYFLYVDYADFHLFYLHTYCNDISPGFSFVFHLVYKTFIGIFRVASTP